MLRWLRRQQPVICPGCRPTNLQDFTLLPVAASDQAYEGKAPGFDRLELPFLELDRDESMLAVRKIEHGLPLGYR